MLSASEIEAVKNLSFSLKYCVLLNQQNPKLEGSITFTRSLAIPVALITKEKPNRLEPKKEIGKEFHKQVLKQLNKRFRNILK